MEPEENPEVAPPSNPPATGTPVLFYPSDLGTEQYPHILKIEVLRRTTSPRNPQTGTTNPATRAPTGSISQGLRSITNLKGSTGVVSAFGNLADIATGGIIRTQIFEGLATVGLATGNNLFEGAQYKLEPYGYIYLHINDAPTVSYGANWAQKDLFLAGSTQQDAMLNNLYNSLTLQRGENAVEFGKQLASGVGNFITSNTSQDALDYLITQQAQQDTEFGSFGTSFNVKAGFALNPFKAQVFSGHPFRTFTFKYKFLPKNSSEALSVAQIIQSLKFMMHGKYDGMKIVYPGEFKISYVYTGGDGKEKDNTGLFRTKNCALTKLDITYGEGDYVSFSDGSSVETNVTMTFTELELLSQQDVIQSDGY